MQPEQDETGTPPRTFFDEAYDTGTAPWVIGEPQPAILELERDGWIGGHVLDAGCGSGEHTIALAGRGYEVLGVDSSASAIAQARRNAAARGVSARFEVADALTLGEAAYDTIIDSALFHIFDEHTRPRYVESLHRASRPGALVHVLAIAEDAPGIAPRVGEETIRTAFTRGWQLEDLRKTHYRGALVLEEHATTVGRPLGEHIDLPAWLARVRKTGESPNSTPAAG